MSYQEGTERVIIVIAWSASRYEQFTKGTRFCTLALTASQSFAYLEVKKQEIIVTPWFTVLIVGKRVRWRHRSLGHKIDVAGSESRLLNLD